MAENKPIGFPKRCFFRDAPNSVEESFFLMT